MLVSTPFVSGASPTRLWASSSVAFDEKGCTCKEIGALQVWEKSKSEDEGSKVYHREYKKRSAWIRAGKITKDEFYIWSEKAREKKAECEEEKITLEESGRWLKEP